MSLLTAPIQFSKIAEYITIRFIPTPVRESQFTIKLIHPVTQIIYSKTTSFQVREILTFSFMVADCPSIRTSFPVTFLPTVQGWVRKSSISAGPLGQYTKRD